jgi:hypothetical protein
MAIGDDATSAGFPLVPDTGEEGRKRWGAREINRTRDLIALVKNLIPVGKPANRAAAGLTYGTGLPTGGADGDVHHRIFNGATFTFVRHNGEWIQSPVGGGGGGEGGVSDHSLLTGRTAADQHPIGAITALQGALDSKASINDPRFDQGGDGGVTSHPLLTERNNADQHSIGAVTGLQTALDGKAASSHSHPISQVTNLQTNLNAKVDNSGGVTSIQSVTAANYPASPVANRLYVVF